METFVLDDFPFPVEMTRLLELVRVKEGGEDEDAVRRMAAAAEKIGRPRALGALAFIDDKGDDFVVIEGLRFTSRVLRVNLEEAHRVFPFVITAGPELKEWAGQAGDGLAQFWARALEGMAMFAAAQALDHYLAEKYGEKKTAMMNPGSLADWPLTEQRPLFQLLGEAPATIGVTLLETGFMDPPMSGSGLRFPAEASFESCLLCPRPDCPLRRAPYDPGLDEAKYRK